MNAAAAIELHVYAIIALPLAGAGLMALIWWLSESSFRNYLVLKAERQHRTAVHLDGKFFYIVPESEYVDMELAVLARSNKAMLGASPYVDRRQPWEKNGYHEGDRSTDARPLR